MREKHTQHFKQSEAHWQKSMYQKAGFWDYIRQGEGIQRAIAAAILITFYEHRGKSLKTQKNVFFLLYVFVLYYDVHEKRYLVARLLFSAGSETTLPKNENSCVPHLDSGRAYDKNWCQSITSIITIEGGMKESETSAFTYIHFLRRLMAESANVELSLMEKFTINQVTIRREWELRTSRFTHSLNPWPRFEKKLFYEAK